jgi:hypothetical protein
MTDPSPPGNGNGVRQDAGPKNERDIQLIADSATVVNRVDRSLLEHNHASRTKLWAEQIGRRTRYLVEQGERTWTFSLLWSALSKFDRLSRQRGQQ